MKLLIVDDQQAITESIKKGIRWEEAGVEEVFTANSADEAKLLITNFPVDVLLTDIEMPGDSGLALVRWVKEKNFNIKSIFLTSHADFSYAREAIGLGGVDYILQPARYEEIQASVVRACEQIKEARKITWMREMEQTLQDQKDVFLGSMIAQAELGNTEGAGDVLRQILHVLNRTGEDQVLGMVQIVMKEEPREIDEWTEGIGEKVFNNVMDEIFEDTGAEICTIFREHLYSILVICEKTGLDDSLWLQKLDRYYHFLDEKVCMAPQIYYSSIMQVTDTALTEKCCAFYTRPGHRIHVAKGLYPETEGVRDENDERIRKAEEYIHTHIYKNISRAEVAEVVYLNEEYFSKLFSKYTGWTFKDYVIKEKMKVASQLLANTNLSVSVIATKTGFDNFSHFSRTFKKLTDMTPQEYRKSHQKG